LLLLGGIFFLKSHYLGFDGASKRFVRELGKKSIEHGLDGSQGGDTNHPSLNSN
jgi:hypothetical protein